MDDSDIQNKKCERSVPGAEVLPADRAVQPAHDEHGDGEVPRVAHGDEHHVVMVLQVPLGAVGRIQHETNLKPKRGSILSRALPEAFAATRRPPDLPARTSSPAAA